MLSQFLVSAPFNYLRNLHIGTEGSANKSILANDYVIFSTIASLNCPLG